MSAPESYPRPFGKYVLIAPLAQGGMGELHLAVGGRADLRKLYVIKQIIGHLAGDDYQGRFADETALMVKLSHGNLVPVFEGGVRDGQYYIVMEFIDGRDLRRVWDELAAQQRTCPLSVALFIVKEICRGLHYVHTHGDLGLVHRDISPPNVLLSYSGEVKLTDFGLAYSTIKLQKTAPGMLFGKLSYMAPEQARNEPIDARTDIYSTGVILWELVTGQRLFPATGGQLEQLTRAATPQVSAPSSVNDQLPPELDLITMRALAPKRQARYKSADAMRKDIANLLARIDPTIDASSVQRTLAELFVGRIENDRLVRERLLDEMSPELQRMLEREEEQAERHLPTNPQPRTPPSSSAAAGTIDHSVEGSILPVLAPGTVLGERYRIDAMLREGGMGTVYLATHTEIEKTVAVKVLHPMYTRMPDVVERFRREARAASRIGHPNIVEVYDSGTTDDGSVYFVMEHLEGQDLADVLDEVGRVEIDRSLAITLQICDAVAAAHEAGIVHRDLKPENVFLTYREGRVDFVKVLDFGIAQMAQDASQDQLTTPGTPIGTPEYMAPEQAAGKECDHRADIYTVATILYEMLTGEAPHQGETAIEVLRRKADPVITPARELREEIPPELERLVMWTLSFEPEARPQSMAELAYELNKLTKGRAQAVASMLGLREPTTSRSLTPNTTGPLAAATEQLPAARANDRRRIWALGAGAGALVLLLVLLLTARSGDEAPVAGNGAANAGAAPARLAAADARALEAATTASDATPTQPTRPAAANAADPSRAPTLPPRARARSLIRTGRRQLRSGNFEQARQALVAALRFPATRAQALTGLAELEFQQGHYRRARSHATKALAAGGKLRAQLVLGNVHFKLGEFAKAVQMYEKVLSRKADHAEARRNLTAAQARLGR